MANDSRHELDRIQIGHRSSIVLRIWASTHGKVIATEFRTPRDVLVNFSLYALNGAGHRKVNLIQDFRWCAATYPFALH